MTYQLNNCGIDSNKKIAASTQTEFKAFHLGLRSRISYISNMRLAPALEHFLQKFNQNGSKLADILMLFTLTLDCLIKGV